jgi:hypothetical protein
MFTQSLNMKGKNVFTTTEIAELRRLITLRMKSEPSAQKAIRDKMRKIGLFGKDDWGITDMKLSGLDSLIASGRILIIGGSKLVPVKPSAEKPIKTETRPASTVNDLALAVTAFKANRFDPAVDSSSVLPDSCGNYLICLKPNAEFPVLPVKPSFTLFNGLRVLYTGIAGTSLRHRDFKAHFNGQAGRSTLRKSVGVLFGYKLIPRDSDPTTGKTTFDAADETRLTAWMRENLLLFFYSTSNYGPLEPSLIHHFNPPLNLKDCKGYTNREFRAMLAGLRAMKDYQ